MDAEERTRAEHTLKNLVDHASNSDTNCHLSTPMSSAEIPLVPIMAQGNSHRIQTWGLHVFFNNQHSVLGVDTGASGLVISRAVAERAGLKEIARGKIGGVGDQGMQGAYIARADSIRIGSLEFRDCIVQVTDKKDILSMDGLIGTDVLSSYLVTLDYPMSKLILSQLPPRPTDSAGAVSGLNTGGGEPVATGSGTSAEAAGPQDRFTSPTMKDYSPVFRAGHDLIIPTLLNGKVQRLFIIDTGAFATTISPEAARSVTKIRGGAAAGSVQGLSGDVANIKFTDAILFQFGGIQQQNNDLFAFDTANMSRGAGMEISGLLGSTVLRQLTISIDYRDGLIKFAYDPHHGNHNF